MSITPITVADRKRAGTSAEHYIRLAGRMALADTALQMRQQPKPSAPPQRPRRGDDEPPRAA